MTFDDFKHGPAAAVFSALGDGGHWSRLSTQARDWQHLRELVTTSNMARPGSCAGAARRLAGHCSRGEVEALKAICHVCDFSALADELSAGAAWGSMSDAHSDQRRMLAACILNAP